MKVSAYQKLATNHSITDHKDWNKLARATETVVKQDPTIEMEVSVANTGNYAGTFDTIAALTASISEVQKVTSSCGRQYPSYFSPSSEPAVQTWLYGNFRA